MLDDYRAEQLPALLRQKTTDLATQAHNTNDLAKAAKAVGATVKTSDLVGMTGQVPQLGEVGQVAPQLFDLAVGNISGPISAGPHRRGGEDCRQAGTDCRRDCEES